MKQNTLKLMALSSDLAKIQDLINYNIMLKQDVKHLEQAAEFWHRQYTKLKKKLEKYLE